MGIGSRALALGVVSVCACAGTPRAFVPRRYITGDSLAGVRVRSLTDLNVIAPAFVRAVLSFADSAGGFPSDLPVCISVHDREPAGEVLEALRDLSRIHPMSA